jgi:hypothetical protein
LADNAYVVVPVTFDNHEWVYAAAYKGAVSRRDESLRHRVGDAYLAYMAHTITFFEQRSRDVLGREPPQVLLIHANLLNADYFDGLAAMLTHRGYAFVGVEAALRDAVYRQPDVYVGGEGLSWIHRWGLARGLPLLREPPKHSWLTTLEKRRR